MRMASVIVDSRSPAMFLRRYTRKKDGKPHTDYALVERVRTEAGPRQNVVAYLGELNHDQERRWQRTVVFHNRQRGESGSDLVLSGFHGTSLIIAWAFQASCDLGQLPDQGRRSSEGLVHATRQVWKWAPGIDPLRAKLSA
jgi:hypothetical protein